MRNLYLRQDLNPILVATMLSMFLKLQDTSNAPQYVKRA